MAIHTDHDISELDETIAKVCTVRDICADPEVELIDLMNGETAIIATWHMGIQTASGLALTRFMAALGPKQENITHTDWHTFTHRRDLEKVTCYLPRDAVNVLSDIADGHESSIEDAIGWLIGRYVAEMDEDGGA